MELIRIDMPKCGIHGQYYWCIDNEKIGFATSIVYETKEQAIMAMLSENTIWETLDLHDLELQLFIGRRDYDRYSLSQLPKG